MNNALCLHNATVLTGFSTMKNCAVYIKDGLIADVYNEERFRNKQFSPKVKVINVNGAYIMPGLIDSHIHGIGGFSADAADEKQLLSMSLFLASCGVTSFIPTLCTSKPEIMLKKIKAVVKAMGHEKGARILGMHLEGPFISPERIGAQPADGVCPADVKLMDKFWKASKGHIVNMTVAPEIKGMRELALFCLEKGIVLQAGHTNATYEQMIEGMQVNIMHVTHLFNAMRPLHHREPGVVGAALIHPEISCEFIGDGVHVNPNLIKLLMKSKPLSQLVLITDAFDLAKTKLSPNSEYYFDQCFHRKKDDVIIGSGISMLDGLRNLIRNDIPPEKAIRMAATNPARIMKQNSLGSIIPGFKADLIVLNKDLDLMYTIIDGKIFKERKNAPHH